MKTLIAVYKVKKEHVETVKKAIFSYVKEIKEKEPDTILYEAYQQNDSITFFHIMDFKDAEAEQGHRDAAHTKKFVKKVYPLCDEEPVFTDLTLLASNRDQ